MHLGVGMPSAKQVWGNLREEMAERALLRAGYAIVARNWRGGRGEIDRIAWKSGVLCFVEVRARSTDFFGTPAETVASSKQRKLVRAAAAYLMRYPPKLRPDIRFDIVSILDPPNGPRTIEIIPNAFDATVSRVDKPCRFF